MSAKSMDLIPVKLRQAIPETREIPREFVQKFATEHLHRLRKRVFWYCVAVLGLLVLAFTRIILDMTMPEATRPYGHIGYIALRAISATTLLVCYAAVIMYILPDHRGRRDIIKAYSILIIVTTLVITLAMPRIDNGRLLAGAEPGEYGAPAVAQQAVTLFFILLLHLVASLLVELSPRDGIRIYVPMLAIYGIGLLIDPFLSVGAKLWMALIAPILGLPGLLWSLWRHRAFADRFMARTVSELYDKVSKELAEARRVHEALFPPAQAHGPIQVRYRYEPMLDIGGDFLFIHPIQTSRGAADAPTSVVLIDVTGHGFPAALAVNRLYVELTRAFISSEDPTPAHVISELNRAMASGLMPSGIFATAIVLRTREHDGKRILEWCGAGHPPAILRRAEGQTQWLTSGSPMLGVVDGDLFRCETKSAELRPGDAVVAYTDGVLEARAPDTEQFGAARIEAEVLRRSNEGGDAVDAAQTVRRDIASSLLRAVERFRQGPTLDDVLIVELKVAEAEALTAVTNDPTEQAAATEATP